MLGIKPFKNTLDPVFLEEIGINRQRHFKRLTSVANIDFKLRRNRAFRHAIRGKLAARLLLHFIEHRDQIGNIRILRKSAK